MVITSNLYLYFLYFFLYPALPESRRGQENSGSQISGTDVLDVVLERKSVKSEVVSTTPAQKNHVLSSDHFNILGINFCLELQ